MKHPLRFIVSYFQPVTQHYESRTSQKALLQSIKNTEINFHYEGKPSCTTAKSAPFAISKYEWDTKEDISKFKKNACVSLKPNSEIIKPVALAIIKLYLLEGISQSVTQSVTQSLTRKFRLIIPYNFLKVFWIDLNALFGLSAT